MPLYGLPPEQATALEQRIAARKKRLGNVGRIIQDVKAQQTAGIQQQQQQTWMPTLGVPGQVTAPTAQPPTWTPGAEVAAPEVRQPAAWETPVPETWGEWLPWWGKRQIGKAIDWFQRATEEVWERPEATFWEAAKAKAEELPTKAERTIALIEEEGLTLPTAVNFALTAVGIAAAPITVPLAGAKTIPGFIGMSWRALEQATKGVTGAIVGGLNIIDTGLMEQGLLGAGAELLVPLVQGHKADFTPQEFEAGRNRYTRWWTEISQGRDASQELYDLTMEKIRGGYQPEDIEADSTLSSPVAELIGRLVLDPLNLIPASLGAKARMGMSKEAAAKIFGAEDLTDYAKLLDLKKTEGSRGLVYRALHPLSLDNPSLAGQWSERTALILGQALENSTDPGDFGNMIRAFVMAGDDNAATAKSAQIFLRSKLGTLPVSTAGKETTLLMREILRDPKTGEVALSTIADWLKKSGSDDEILGGLLKGLDGALQRVYPTPKIGPVKQVQNKYRTFLTKYMYMGWNPGYALRNATSNTFLAFLSGNRPLRTAETVGTFAQRWGGIPFNLRTGYGGPAGEYIGVAIESALKQLGTKYDAVRLKDLPDSVITSLKDAGLKAAPMMRLSEAFETAAGERIIYDVLNRFWKEHWKPRLPDEVRNLFPAEAQAMALETMLADAMTPDEIHGLIGPALAGRNLPDELLQRIDEFPSGLKREVMRAHLEAADANDFTARLQDISRSVDDWLTQTMGEWGTEISKDDDLLQAIVKGDREVIEELTDKELAQGLHRLQDDWEAELTRLRARQKAVGEMLARQAEQAGDDGSIARLFADHQQASTDTAARVDKARAQAWAASDASPRGIKGTAERNRIWSATDGSGPFNGMGYFPYRRDEWGRYWNDFDQQGRAFLAGEAPEMGAEMAEEVAQLVEKFRARSTPTRYAVAAISTEDTQQIIADVIEAAPGLHFGDMPGLPDEAVDALRGWMDEELIPHLHETKAIANKVAMNERDFVLYNYTKRTNLDNALSYLYPYHYWYSRSAVNIPKMLLYNPKVLDAYMDYKDMVHKLNEEAQGLPWWREQIRVPGTDYYFNLEATLNPLYSMITDFHDPERTATLPGTMLEKLGSLGPSVDVIFWAVYAAWRAQQEEPGEALAAMGYLGQPTKAFRYATALMGLGEGKGITLEPWLWDDPWSFQGLDKWERRRIGYHLQQMVEEDAITAAQAWDAGFKKTGDTWNEAVARHAQDRGPGTIASLFLGVGLKPRHAWEMQIDLALHAEREFYAHAETAYDLSTDEGQDAYREAQQKLYEYYPFLSYVRLVRRGEMERDRAYAWEVLNRIPPGSVGYSIKERVGMTDATVDLFYQSIGHFDDWSDIDRANFMAKVEALGAILGVPDLPRRNEWDSAREAYGEVKADLREQFGEDIFDIQNLYFDVQDTAGRDAAQVILDQNPQLGEMWDYRGRAIAADDALMAYWGSLDTLDRLADNLRYDELERRWPNYQEVNAAYFKDFPKEQWKEKKAYRREYLKANSWLKDAWDLNDALRKDMEAMVEHLVSKMKPPLGPVVRPDTDLASVLTQEAQKIIEFKYQAGEWIKGPRGEPLETTPPIVPIGGAVEAPLEEPLKEPLDITTETVVQSRVDRAAAGGGVTVSPPRKTAPAPSGKFSWQVLKESLGTNLTMKLVGHLLQGFPLSGELKARLEEIYAEYPLGLTELDDWLAFVKTLWRASIVSGSSRTTGRGLAYRPRPLLGTSQPGAGRRFTPWG